MLYTSERRFEVRHWGVGHAGLLLRSHPTAEHSRRVELLFKPTGAVCLPALLDGITIQEADDADTAAWQAQAHGLRLSSHDTLFVVTSGSVRGWVVGGSATGREDGGDYAAPSTFDGTTPGPDVTELFTTHQG